MGEGKMMSERRRKTLWLFLVEPEEKSSLATVLTGVNNSTH